MVRAFLAVPQQRVRHEQKARLRLHPRGRALSFLPLRDFGLGREVEKN